MEKMWWLNVMVERLIARGDLSKEPRSPAACFYNNPLGNLAQDKGTDMSDPYGWKTDLCRDWKLVTNTPNIWEFLALNGQPASGDTEKLLQQLVALNDGRVFQWVALYEWMAKEVLKVQRHAVPQKSPYPRMLLRAYATVFERIRDGLNLSDATLKEYKPIGSHSVRIKNNGRSLNIYQWKEAPPYAAMLLIPYLRSGAGEESRGIRLMYQYLVGANLGALVETPSEVCDLPNSRTPKRPVSYRERFETAMAVDRYVYEHPEFLEQIQAMKWPVERMPQIETVCSPGAFAQPLQTSEQYAEALALAWVNRSGKKTVENDASHRFALTASPELNPAVQHCSCKLSIDDEGPLVCMCVVLSADYPDDVYNLKVVILTEATVDGVDQSDTCFGHVEHADVQESGDSLNIALELRPTFANYSLLFQLQRCQLTPTSKAVVTSVVDRGISRMVVGVHAVLGPI